MRVSLIGLFTKDLPEKLPTSWGELVSFCNGIDEITSSDHERLQQHIKSTLDKRSVLPVPLLELRNALAELQSSIDANNCEEITQALFVRAYSLIINKIQNELRSFLKIERGNNAPFPDSELDYANHDDHMAAKIMWNYILMIERIRQNIDIDFTDVIGKDTQVVRQYKYLVSGEFSEKFSKPCDESSPFFQYFLTLQCISATYATQLYNNTSKKYTSILVAEKLLAAFNVGKPAYMLQKFSRDFVWKQIYSENAHTKTQLEDDLKKLTPFHKSKSVTPDAIKPTPSPENEFERKAHALHEKTALAAEQFTLEEEASTIAKSATEIEKNNLPKIDIVIRQLTLLKQYLENSFPTLASHTFTRERKDERTKQVTTEIITNSLNQLINDLTNLRKQVKEKIDEAAPRAEKIKTEFEKTKSEKAALTEELTQDIEAEIKSKEQAEKATEVALVVAELEQKTEEIEAVMPVTVEVTSVPAETESKKQAEPEKEVKEVKQPEPAQDTEAEKLAALKKKLEEAGELTPLDVSGELASPSTLKFFKSEREILTAKIETQLASIPPFAIPVLPEIEGFTFKKSSVSQVTEPKVDKIDFIEKAYREEQEEIAKFAAELEQAASQPSLQSLSSIQNLGSIIQDLQLQDAEEKAKQALLAQQLEEAEKAAEEASKLLADLDLPVRQDAVEPLASTQPEAVPAVSVPELILEGEDEHPLALASVSRAYNVSDLLPVDENEEPIALAAPLRAPQPLVGGKEDKIAPLNKPTFWQLNGSSITSGATIILGAVGAAVAASLAWPVFVIAIAIATMLFLPIAAYLLTERFCGVKVEEAKIPGTSSSGGIHQRLGGEIVGIANGVPTPIAADAPQQPSGARIPAVPMPGLQPTQ